LAVAATSAVATSATAAAIAAEDAADDRGRLLLPDDDADADSDILNTVRKVSVTV
jgi:hypothetical protein